MEKEFVPYKQALALKELGFESPYPIGGYQGGKVFYYEKGELYYDGRPMYSSDAHSGQLLAPLYQQAFRFFRENHNLHSTIALISNSDTERRYMVMIDYIYPHKAIMEFEEYEIHEEAELECLKKLIKIVNEIEK